MKDRIRLGDLPSRPSRRQVICGCMFHHELDALDWRLHELDSVVDDFIVVESVRTHSGNPRELVHPERSPRFAHSSAGCIPSSSTIRRMVQTPGFGNRFSEKRSGPGARCSWPGTTISSSSPMLTKFLSQRLSTVSRFRSSTFRSACGLTGSILIGRRISVPGLMTRSASIRQECSGSCPRAVEGLKSGTIQRRPPKSREFMAGTRAGLDRMTSFSISCPRTPMPQTNKDQIAIAEGAEGIQRRRASGLDMYGGNRKIRQRPRLPVHAHRISEKSRIDG